MAFAPGRFTYTEEKSGTQYMLAVIRILVDPGPEGHPAHQRSPNMASGWGGNPAEAAQYVIGCPKANDARTVYKVTVKDVPVDGFWSISVYDKERHFEKNDLGAYSISNITATPNADGSITAQFGGCEKNTPNRVPTPPDWNYTVRMYRPRKAILDGTWNFLEPQPMRQSGRRRHMRGREDMIGTTVRVAGILAPATALGACTSREGGIRG